MKYILLIITIFVFVSCGTKDKDVTTQPENQVDNNNEVEQDSTSVENVLPEPDPTKYQARERSEDEYPEADPTKN